MSWPLVKLGAVCKLVNGDRGTNYPSKDSILSHGIPFINAGNLTEDHSIVCSGANYISEERYDLLSNGKIQFGDILFCLRGSLGKFAVVDSSVPKGAIASSLVIIRPDKSICEDYLKNYLRSTLCAREISRFENGAAQPNLSAKDLREFEIPLPPLPEQKRIAAILDKADAIRRKRQQAIQLADDFLRSVFLDMFGDPGANPKGFNEAVLGELTTGKTNNGLFRKNDEYGGSVPVAWVGELFRGNKISFSEGANRIDPTEKEIDAYGLKYGDLLFCRSSLKLEGIGFNNIYLGDNDNALFECHLIRMSPCLEKVNPVFLNYQLRMPSIRARIFQQAKTSTMTTIDQAGLSRIKVFVPPLDLQEEFERRLVKVESLYSHLYKNKSLDELAFSSISQKAFSGQL